MESGLIWILAVASGLTAANLYYNQPLLPQIAAEFAQSAHAIGWVPTLAQAGYGAGMLLIVPLGDSLNRRRMILVLVSISCVLLGAVALSPSLPLLALFSLLLGFATVIPQVALPFAASLAPAAQRGRVVGLVMSGLLMGILLSRTAAGFLGASHGWRSVYWTAAGLMVLLGLLLYRTLPSEPPRPRLPYMTLLGSILTLAKEEPALRFHAFLGAVSFAAFSAFWATLSLHLAALPGRYGPRVAGLYGAVGLAGVLVAPLAGRHADQRGGRRVNVIALASLLAAFGVLFTLQASLWGIALGVTLLDFGTQANQVTNQARVYSLRDDSRSRLNTVYMASYFTGGALGALMGTAAYRMSGWSGVCGVGAGFTLLGLVALLFQPSPPARNRPQATGLKT